MYGATYLVVETAVNLFMPNMNPTGERTVEAHTNQPGIFMRLTLQHDAGTRHQAEKKRRPTAIPIHTPSAGDVAPPETRVLY